MRHFALLLVTLFAQNVFAELPVVTAETFTPGRSWTWEYRQEDGSLYSTERYTVLSQSNGELWIEMATELAGETSFKSHHRLHVSLTKCLEAYRSPSLRKPWSIELYYLENGQWMPTVNQKTLAFEEKFNCNPHLHGEKSKEYATLFRSEDSKELFQQKRWRKIESTWFLKTGMDAGVAYTKDFRSPSLNYKMKLVQ